MKSAHGSRTGIWIPIEIWELDLAPMDRVLLAEVASFAENGKSVLHDQRQTSRGARH